MWPQNSRQKCITKKKQIWANSDTKNVAINKKNTVNCSKKNLWSHCNKQADTNNSIVNKKIREDVKKSGKNCW